MTDDSFPSASELRQLSEKKLAVVKTELLKYLKQQAAIGRHSCSFNVPSAHIYAIESLLREKDYNVSRYGSSDTGTTLWIDWS